MIDNNNYDFIDYDYYSSYYNDPIDIIINNEQFYTLRKSFYDLTYESREILNYFIIKRNKCYNINIDEHIDKLKDNYINNYNKIFK